MCLKQACMPYARGLYECQYVYESHSDRVYRLIITAMSLSAILNLLIWIEVKMVKRNLI